jgi:hypothetical protein
MTKNVKSFDFKTLKTDLEYMKEMQNSKGTTLIDEKVALSSLVNKLQKYVFDIEQTTLKQELDFDNTFQQEHRDFGYNQSDLNFKSPDKIHQQEEDYYNEGEESESLYLGNSRELENRLKQYASLKEQTEALESSMQNTPVLKSPLSDSTSNENNYSVGSYAQKYNKTKTLKRKSKK